MLVIEILLGDFVVIIELTLLFFKVGIRVGDCVVFILIPAAETLDSFFSILFKDFIYGLDDGVFFIVFVSSGLIILQEFVIFEISTSILLFLRVEIEVIPISLLVQSKNGFYSAY